MIRPTVAAFSISTQFGNVGDAWIHRELIRLTAARVPTWVDVSRCPPAFVVDLDLDAHPNVTRVDGYARLVSRLLRHRNGGGRSAWFLGPGGYHGERGGFGLAQAWIATVVFAALRTAGVRMCHVGVSYERLGPRHRALLATRSRLLHLHLVRDEASAQYARASGIRTDGVAADIAFADQSWSATRQGEATTVALVFRSDQAPAQRDQVVEFCRRLALAAPGVARWRAIAQVDRDRATAEAVLDALRTAGVEVEGAWVDGGLRAAKAAYQDCSHVVGNRLHGLLLGASAGAHPLPVIDPVLQAKIAGAFAVVPDAPAPIDAADPDAVDRVAAAIARRDRRPLDPTPARLALESALDELLGPPSRGGEHA